MVLGSLAPPSPALGAVVGVVDSSNTGFTVFLAVLGVLAIAGFVWAITKSAIKAVVFFGAVGAAAWYFFFQQ